MFFPFENVVTKSPRARKTTPTPLLAYKINFSL